MTNLPTAETPADDSASTGRTRALVLGGGGVAGIAWESGLLLGLLQAGIDLGEADLVVGTSAGSAVAGMLRAGFLTPEKLAATGLTAAPAEPAPAEAGMAGTAGTNAADPADAAPAEGSASTESSAFDGMRFFQMMQEAATGAGSDQDARARLGERARAVPVSLSQEAWVERMARRLPADWPAGRLAITAVDTTDGAFRVFDADSGVDLARAVAASCTVPTVYPLVDIEGRPHMDGGMRSATNADVAAGHDAVLILSCGPEAPASPYGPTLQASLATLRESGEVLLVSPDEAGVRAFGTNVLDPATQGPAFQAGLAQAAAVADDVRALWG